MSLRWIGYFNSLSNALEMRARTRSVNDKITYAAEVRYGLFISLLIWSYFRNFADAIRLKAAIDRG